MSAFCLRCRNKTSSNYCPRCGYPVLIRTKPCPQCTVRCLANVVEPKVCEECDGDGFVKVEMEETKKGV